MNNRHFGGSNLPRVECTDVKHGVWVGRWDIRDEEDGGISFMEELFDHEPTEAELKNATVTSEHPFGDETKILRKTLAKILRSQGLYDTEEYAEFKAYNDFVENI